MSQLYPSNNESNYTIVHISCSERPIYLSLLRDIVEECLPLRMFGENLADFCNSLINAIHSSIPSEVSAYEENSVQDGDFVPYFPLRVITGIYFWSENIRFDLLNFVTCRRDQFVFKLIIRYIDATTTTQLFLHAGVLLGI